MPASSSADRNFATCDSIVSPASANCARPFAPLRLAIAVRSSISLRVAFAFPGTTIARTTPFWSIVSRKTLNPLERKTSVRSMISIANRRSGRSIPNRRMASSNVMRGQGTCFSGLRPYFLKIAV